MAHRITAGADLLLMPSRFEPCGLNQVPRRTVVVFTRVAFGTCVAPACCHLGPMWLLMALL
jgi:hypothetical protein